MPQITTYPLVNGVRFSHASCEIKWGGFLLMGVKDLDYSEELTPGELRGTAPQVIGRTRGIHKAAASLSMFRLEWEILRTRFGLAGNGYGETTDDITVTIAEFGVPPIIDTLFAPRITKIQQTSSSDSADGLLVKIDLNIMRLLLGAGQNSIALARNLGI